jgi:hypothetical protein
MTCVGAAALNCHTLLTVLIWPPRYAQRHMSKLQRGAQFLKRQTPIPVTHTLADALPGSKAAPIGASSDSVMHTIELSRLTEMTLQQNPNAMLIVTPNGTIWDWSSSAEWVFGFTANEAVVRELLEGWHAIHMLLPPASLSKIRMRPAR